MTDPHPRPNYDPSRKGVIHAIIDQIFFLLLQIPKNTIEFGSAWIINNDGTKQRTKSKNKKRERRND